MQIFHPISRTIAYATLALAFATMVIATAQTQEKSCPPIIASLFPKNASIIGGQYFPGDLSSGDGSAELSFSFENPACVKTEYSSRISVKVEHYGGETAILIKSDESPYGTIDRDAIKEQFIKDATVELTRTNMTPKRETLGIGEIVYVEYKTECPPVGQATAAARVGPIIVPNVKLKGVAWSDNANIQVTLDGPISVDLARAAVAEVFDNLKKAEFSKVK
jgi:hypothetical protein